MTPGELGVLLLRVFAGCALSLAHGLGKLPPSDGFIAGVAAMGFPEARLFAWAAGLAEGVGGLLLAAGLLTRPAAFVVLITMLVAAFVRQAGDPFLERELALLYAGIAAHFLLAGPGRLSLDAVWGRARTEGTARRSVARGTAAVAVLVAASLIASCGERPGDPAEWVVGFVAPPQASAARRGAELGAEEARRAAELVGRRFSLLSDTATTPERVRSAAHALVRRGAYAVVGGFDRRSCEALDAAATELRVLFINIGCRDDRLRVAPGRYTFHVEASAAAYRQREGAGSRGVPTLWHEGLTRYGAGQLNDRFRRRFGTSPGPDEWAGWMAVKLLWESALRVESTEARELAEFLLGPDAKFDGHKGQPLAFAHGDHQLQQPLYLTPADRDSAPVPPPPEPGVTHEPLHLPAERSLVLISNEGSRDIAIVDAMSRKLLARIPVGSRPRGIHVSRDGRFVFVALSDEAPTRESDDDGIAVIDLASGKLVKRFAAGSDPEQFAISPDGTRLYASNEDAGLASVTDLRTGALIAQHPVGIEPEGVAVSPDGRWIYITAETSNTVSVIDADRNAVVASFMVDLRPRAAAFAPDGRTAYVTNEISGTVSVVDAQAHRVIAEIALEDETAKPVGVAVSPDGHRVYVANGHAHSVSVIDPDARRVVATIPVGRRPWGIQLSADGTLLYTANGGSDDLSILDTRSGRVIATVAVGSRPWGVAIRH